MSRMTIGAKLSVTYLALVAALISSTAFGLYSISVLGGELNRAVRVTTRTMDLIQALGKRVNEMEAAANRLQLCYVNEDRGGAAEAKKRFEGARKRVGEQASEVRSLLPDEASRGLLGRIEGPLEAWYSVMARYDRALEESNYPEAYRLLSVEIQGPVRQIGDGVTAMVAHQRGLLAEADLRSEGLRVRARSVTLGILFVAIGIGAAVLWSLRKCLQAMQRIAGDLARAAGDLSSASSQVASAGQTLAQGATEQAASLEETSASSEQITAMTRQGADASQEAAGAMAEMGESVAGANRTLDQMGRSMSAIAVSSGKISKIIKVIDEIAFQTNILALNAAVEAARAGQAGMGFAVVAEEVRNLAQRCAGAAAETSALIEEAVASSGQGTADVGRVVEVVATVTRISTRVRALIEQASTSNQEQSRGIQEIARALSQMEQVTQRTAASAEESAAASQQLTSQAGRLGGIAEELTSMVGAGRSRS